MNINSLSSRLDLSSLRPSFSSSGLFNLGAQWSIRWIPKPLSTKVCFIYPGQGAMFPGMAKGFEESEIFTGFFRRADRLLSQMGYSSVSDYVFTPEKVTLEKLEQVESLALFTFCCALSHEIVKAGFRPEVVTGHSFGEYAALVASGILDFETGLRWVIKREQILPERNDAGYMLAVACSAEEVNNFLQGIPHFISNVNTFNQTVISASWENLVDAEQRLRLRGVRFKRLSSPQPFHSPLLKSSAQQMETFIALNAEYSFPRTDFFSGVLKNWIPGDERLSESIKKIIGSQLTEPVDFIRQIKEISQRCDHFIEVGPRAFLLELIKSNLSGGTFRCTAGLELVKINPKLHRERTLTKEEVNEGVLKKVNSIISRITGYSFEKIKFEDRFQEDLGIDSIKTMEISIEVLNEFHLPRQLLTSVQQVKSVGELAYQIQLESVTKATTPNGTQKNISFQVLKESWINQDFFDHSMSVTRYSDKDFWRVHSLKELEELTGSVHRTISFLFIHFTIQREDISWDCPPELWRENSKKSIRWFSAFQELLSKQTISHSTRIAILTRGSEDPIADMISSFLFSLKKEGSVGFVCHVQFDYPASFEKSEELALKELLLGRNNRVKYQDGQRNILNLERVQEATNAQLPTGAYIVVGGAKGITFEIVKYLASSRAYTFHLIGRTSPSDSQILGALSEIDQLGSRSFYHQTDAGSWSHLEDAFQKIVRQEKNVQGVIHGAGAENSRTFSEKNQQEIADEFFSKVEPTVYLSYLCNRFGISHRILFSSIIAHFGNLGQSIYAAANILSEQIWLHGDGLGTSSVVEWPPWESTGMTSQPIIDQVLRQAGVSLLKREDAGHCFDKVISTSGKMIMDPQDIILFQGPLVDLRRLGLGKLTALPVNSKLALQFSISENDRRWLADHSIKKQTLLPMALVIFLFDELRFLLNTFSMGLSQFHMYRPFEISPNSGSLSLFVTPPNAENHELSLSLFDGNGLLAEAISLGDAPIITDSPSFESDILKIYSPDQLYQPDKLFHGDKFRLLNEVKILQDGTATATIRPEKRYSVDSPTWFPWTVVMDSGLQALAAVGFHFFGGGGLPISIGKIERIKAIADNHEISWQISEVKKTDGSLTANLKLVNQKNEVLVHMEDAQFHWKPKL